MRRVLKRRGRERRKNFNDIDVVVTAIEEEVEGSGSIRYRARHQRLIANHNLVVTRDTVRKVLKMLDPEGVEARS